MATTVYTVYRQPETLVGVQFGVIDDMLFVLGAATGLGVGYTGEVDSYLDGNGTYVARLILRQAGQPDQFAYIGDCAVQHTNNSIDLLTAAAFAALYTLTPPS